MAASLPDGGSQRVGRVDGPVIRPFEFDDAASVRRLIDDTIDACYVGVYPPRAVRYFKELHSLERIVARGAEGQLLVVEQDGTLIGTGAVAGEEIAGVFVHPGAQGHGIGGLVMDELEGIARAGGHASAHLSVSLPSRGFYEHRGYRVIESRSIDVGEGERLDYWEASKVLLEARPARTRSDA